MSIFIYADESGVLDVVHNRWFVFGALVFLNRESRDAENRKYISAERALGSKVIRTQYGEIKATTLNNKQKGKMFRSLNDCYKFAVVIDQSKMDKHIFDHKKSKQRFLDYAL